MVDLIDLAVRNLVKKLREDRKSMDFTFVEYDDQVIGKKMFHCPLYHSVGCDDKFSTSDDFENLVIIFGHIYKRHQLDFDLMKNNYDKWYEDQKDLSTSSSSRDQTNDMLTSHDVEIFGVAPTATTKPIYNKDQRKVKGSEYYQLFMELSSKISGAISDFIQGHISNKQLKEKINTLHVEYLQKISNI